MRWPWQRETPEPPADTPPPGPVPAAEAAVPPAGWAFLPPLQRTIGSAQLTSDPGRFAGALSAWGDPSFMGPMAHLVSAQAPPGVIDVDGGGPVPGDVGYTTAPVEMTLLPAPAPAPTPLTRSVPAHPAPATFGAVATTVQRAVADGGAPDAAVADGDVPEDGAVDGSPFSDGSLLAAEPDPLGVLHVQALPPQPPDPSPSPAVSSQVPKTEASAPGWPRPTEGSTSDGSATYVPLPSAPAVQRATEAQRTSSGPAEPSASRREVPRAPRLGLGMPLSFSEPSGSAEPFPGVAGGFFTLPVQRAAAPESSVPPVPLPTAVPASEHEDGGHDAFDVVPAVEMALPEPGAGPAAEAGAAREAADGPVTASAVLPDQPPTDSAPEPAAGMDEAFHAPAPGDEEPTPSYSPLADASAPLLPAVQGPPSVRHGNGGPGEVRPSPSPHAGSAPDMPVVSRSVPSLDERGAGKIAQAAAPSPPPVAGAVQRDTGAEALSVPVAPAERMGQGEGPGLDLTQGAPSVDGTQDDPMDRAPGAAGYPGTGALAAPPAALLSNPLSDPPAALPVQRAAGAAHEPSARIINTPVSPVVLRVVRTATAGTAPDTWQRLTELPAGLPQTVLPPGSLSVHVRPTNPHARLPELVPAGMTVPSAINQPAISRSLDSASGSPAASTAQVPLVMIGDSGSSRDSGTVDGMGPVTGPATVPALSKQADASPEPRAAVGRVIQRTLSVGITGPANVATSTTVAGTRWPAEADSGPHRPGFPSDRGHAAGLQRWSTSAAAAPPTGTALAQSAPAQATPEPASDPGPAFSSFRPAPGLPTVPGMAPSGIAQAGITPSGTAPPVVLSLAVAPPERAEAGDAIQREAGSSTPGYSTAAQGAPAFPPPVPEVADAQSSARAGMESGSTGPAAQGLTAQGPAEQGQVAGGAATPGAAAGATPEQLEDLAKRLAGPLIRRIKAEMLLDRERRGLRTDAN